MMPLLAKVCVLGAFAAVVYAQVMIWKINRTLALLERHPIRVPCPRCGAEPFVPCHGMRYETHAARDEALAEEQVRESEWK